MVRQISLPLLIGLALMMSGCSPKVIDNMPTPILATIPPLPSVEETLSPEAPLEGFSVSSPLLKNNGAIISQFTCDGPDLSPPLVWKGAPQGIKSYAIVMEDPDAQGGPWVHWVLYNIPSDRTELPQNVAKTETVAGIGVQGVNSAGDSHYHGPCPPFGKSHHYVFTLYALDERIFLPPGTGKSELVKAFQGHILGESTLTGIYQRVQEEVTCCGEN